VKIGERKMSEKILLVERALFEYKAEKIGNKILLSGIIQRAETRNQNGRIYPKEVLMKEISNYDVLVKERRSLGELDHTDESIILLKNVSHVFTKIWWEGNDVHGTAEILPTPNGNTLKSLIESNIKIGTSSRAVGSIKEENGTSIVQSDLVLVGWDMVSDPSTQGAFMGRLNESFNPLDTKVIRENGESEPLFSKEYRINRILNRLICGCEDHCSI
jgi:hypothetical protein